LVDKVPVSDLCDELDVNPNQFYLWQKTFFEQGTAAFERVAKKGKSVADAKDRQIAALQLKLANKNEVISELLEENVRSKKEFGEL
jgi:transposase-like protein